MKKVLIFCLIGVLLFGTIGCASPVEDYFKEKGVTSPEIIKVLKPLGSKGMEPNEKVLIDELVSLPAELQTNEQILPVLKEIAKDMIITPEELSSFQDLDKDGLKNSEELNAKTDPLNPDSDNDGLKDGDEVLVYKTNPLSADTDNDGFSDYVEIMVLKMNPLNSKFDYDMNNTIEDYSQIKSIIEKICKDLGISLGQITIKVLSREKVKEEWEKVSKETLSLTAFGKWDKKGPRENWNGEIFVTIGKAYRVVYDIFYHLGWLDHSLSYSAHFESANLIMRIAPAQLLESAAFRRLEELGCNTYKVGATDKNKAKFNESVNWMKLNPTNAGSQAVFLNCLVVTEEENLNLFPELKTNKKLSSKSTMAVYYHLMTKDNACPGTLQKKMEKRTTFDSYIKEISEIVLSRMGDKPQEESDTVILEQLAFYAP